MRVFLTIAFAAALFGALPQASFAGNSGSSAFQPEAELLLGRVDQLHGQVPAGAFPLGTGTDGKLRLVSGSDWTSGFWASTLWRASDLAVAPARTAAQERAVQATIDHLGFERTKLHDLGFMYGDSSVAGFERVCPQNPANEQCAAMRRSGLIAANTLVALARTTGQGIIPMSARTCSDCRPGWTETIVDSMMNLPLLYWATEETGKRGYRDLARRHARWVERNLQRPDGSTFQAGKYKRSAKRARILRHTHQGRSNTSVWSRGQAWSVYGFSLAGREFRSKRLLAIAERNAAFISRNLPEARLPLWDYLAQPSDPRDVSAGVITAAGLFHLARACKQVPGGCKQPGRWAPLARSVLAGSLSRIRTSDPAGYLGSQVYTLGGRTSWDDDAELIFGLAYALEAIYLARQPL